MKVISELIEGNSQILYDDKKMIAFLYFIGHQLSRTKAFEEKILIALAKDYMIYGKKTGGLLLICLELI